MFTDEGAKFAEKRNSIFSRSLLVSNTCPPPDDLSDAVGGSGNDRKNDTIYP